MKLYLVFGLLFLCYCFVKADRACTRFAGQCKNNWKNCDGGTYVGGLCNGGSRRQCCLRGTDMKCTWSGGKCQYSGSHCSGTYVKGKCAGNRYRQCCVKTAKACACEVLNLHNAGKIKLWKRHPSGVKDEAYAYNNIKDACNGNEAKLSSYSCRECPNPRAPGGSVRLTKKLLCYIAHLAVRGYIRVNEVAGACHSCKSRHYRGLAVDLRRDGRRQEYIDTCNSMGGRGIDERSHIHCQF